MPTLEDQRGTWVLQQANDATQLERFRPSIEKALAFANVKGFSFRVPWKAIDTNFDLLAAGKKIADSAGKAYSVRFMAGRHTPARVFDAGAHYYLLNGEKIPTPFKSDGTPGNYQFTRAYNTLVSKLATWCKANNVKLLHLAWWGRLWAEIDNGADTIQQAPGYSQEAWLAGHKKLIEIGARYDDGNLALEFPFSGYWGNYGGAHRELCAEMRARFGDWSTQLFVQANVLGVYQANPVGSLPIYHGMQMYDQKDYDWTDIYRQIREKKSIYIEIYTPSFALANKDQLQSEITKFANSPLPTYG